MDETQLKQMQSRCAFDAPPFEAVLKPAPVRRRRPRAVFIVAAMALAGVAAFPFFGPSAPAQQDLALAAVPTTDWLLETSSSVWLADTATQQETDHDR